MEEPAGGRRRPNYRVAGAVNLQLDPSFICLIKLFSPRRLLLPPRRHVETAVCPWLSRRVFLSLVLSSLGRRGVLQTLASSQVPSTDRCCQQPLRGRSRLADHSFPLPLSVATATVLQSVEHDITHCLSASTTNLRELQPGFSSTSTQIRGSRRRTTRDPRVRGCLPIGRRW